MPYRIDEYMPGSGRQLLESSSIINYADIARRKQYFTPYEMALTKDRDYSALTSNMFMYSINTALGTVEEILKDNDETSLLMSAATTLTLVSTSTADATAGDGAGTVYLIGLDADRNQIAESVELNGTTEVTTTNEFLRLNRANVISAGATTAPVGTIYIGEGAIVAGKPTYIYGVIIPGVGQMRQGRLSTPANYQAVGNQIITSVGKGKDVIYTFRIKSGSSPWVHATTLNNYQNIININMSVPQRLGESIDLELLAYADVAGVVASGYAVISLVHNNLLPQDFDVNL